MQPLHRGWIGSLLALAGWNNPKAKPPKKKVRGAFGAAGTGRKRRRYSHGTYKREGK